MTNVSGTKEQKENLLKSVGVAEESISIFLNNPPTMLRLMSQISTTGNVPTQLVREITENNVFDLSNNFDQPIPDLPPKL